MHRIVLSLLQPHVFLYGIMAVALIRLWRRQPPVPRSLLLGLTVPFVLLSILGLPVVAYLALGSLEWPYPPLERRPADAQAIVVLAGYVRAANDEHLEAELGEGTLYRCVTALELNRQGPPLPILVSGGRPGAEEGPAFADAMRDFLVRLGTRPEAIIVEDQSNSTHENAVESARLLQARGLTRVVLVTDAAHLQRSVGCFRKQGIDAIPCGCRYRATDYEGSLLDFVPDAAAAVKIRAAAHEWLGIAWYWLQGRL